MKKSIIFFQRCIKQTYRNAERMSVILILPILFTVGLAWIYGDESSFVIVDDQGPVYKIGVINQDILPVIDLESQTKFQSYFSSLNITYLNNSLQNGFGNSLINGISSGQVFTESDTSRFHMFFFNNTESAANAVQSRFISLCMIIPSNFSQTILAGLNHRINVTTGFSASNQTIFYYSYSSIEIIGDFSYARFSEALILLEDILQRFTNNFWIPGLVNIQGLYTSISKISTRSFTEFDIFTPALLIFILITSSTGVSAIVGFEKEDETIDRLKLSGFPPNSYFIGLTLTQLICTAITMAIIFGTLYFLGFPYQNLNQIIVGLLICCTAILPLLGISLSMAALSDGQLATYIPSLIGIPLAFLSGNFVPLPRISLIGSIQMWHLNPFYSVGAILRKILILNANSSSYILDIGMLIIIGGLFYIIGGIIFIRKAYH
ncbi:ABC transporter permease [Candidatus Hodarchaeum mangrovi]